jgi:hypothetical protein
VLRREGDQWLVEYAGTAVRVRATKGLRDLATLLARPDAEVAALDLASPAPASASRRAAVADGGDVLLDDQARREYRARITELRADVEEATAANDIERAGRAQAELDLLLAELAAATGLGGRPRRAGSDVERARKAVSARLADTIDRLTELHPPLGRHLRNSIRTGSYCCYRPEQPTRWQIEP